jgi:hypothetical protein
LAHAGTVLYGDVRPTLLDSRADLTYGHCASAHNLSLKNALKMSRQMGAKLPDNENVTIVAAEAAHVLTPEIAMAVPKAVEIVVNML